MLNKIFKYYKCTTEPHWNIREILERPETRRSENAELSKRGNPRMWVTSAGGQEAKSAAGIVREFVWRLVKKGHEKDAQRATWNSSPPPELRACRYLSMLTLALGKELI